MSEHAAGWQEAPAAAVDFSQSPDSTQAPGLLSRSMELHGSDPLNDALFDHALLDEVLRDPDDHGDW